MIVVELSKGILHELFHTTGFTGLAIFQLQLGVANVIVRQFLSIKAGDASCVGIAHVRGGNSQAVVLVHISMLGAVGKRYIKDGGAARFIVQAHRVSIQIVDVFDTVIGVRHGFVAPHLGNCQLLLALVGFQIGCAVLAYHFLHLAQFDGLVALGIFLDVEGDLEMTGVRVIGNGIVQIFLRLLLRLFLGLLLGVGAFALSRGLALFLTLSRGLALFLTFGGGLRLGGVVLAVVLVLALDVVLVVLGGAGQGLDGVGLLRALNGGFIVRRGIVTVALAVGGLVGVVTGGSDRLFFGLSVIRRGVGVRIAVGQRNNGHLQAGVIRVGQGFGCGGTAHANRAAEHRKGQRHRNDLLLLGLFSHNRPPHFTRDCVPRTTFQKSPAQNRRPLGSPYNPILYTFSKNFKGANCTKKSLHGNFG